MDLCIHPLSIRQGLLNPALDDLLDDWMASLRSSFEGIRVVGLRWSPKSHETKDFLSRNGIPYRCANT